MAHTEKGNTIIALCGKGGVGKTTTSALIVKALTAEPGNRVLAIDADPAVGLVTALNIDVKTTVDDIRNELSGGAEGVKLSRNSSICRVYT